MSASLEPGPRDHLLTERLAQALAALSPDVIKQEPLDATEGPGRLARHLAAALLPLRWTHLLGLPGQTIRTARTLRRRLLTIPGRLTRTARTTTQRMPARWPWADDFLAALAGLRALPPPA